MPRIGTLRGADTADPPGADAGVAALYVEQRLGLVRLAVLLVDDLESAQDVVQDAFARLHRAWTRHGEPDNALAYVRASVVNGARSALRRRRVARRYPHAGLDVSSSPPADEPVLRDEEYRRVLSAVMALPSRQREVIVLRYWSQLTESEVAQTLGISVGSVKSNASRGRAAIALHLGGRQ